MDLRYQRHATGRVFENAFFEACSKARPETPFLFYPALLLSGWTVVLARGAVGVRDAAVFLPLGFLSWFGMEYGLHRFLFHWEGRGRWTKRAHEVIHGYHHLYPDDPDRLVMPLAGSLPLAAAIGVPLWLLGVPSAAWPFFTGVVLGYLHYDFLHYAAHHLTLSGAWWKALRAHHMAHHFVDPTRNFGISNRWSDALWGTLRVPPGPAVGGS